MEILLCIMALIATVSSLLLILLGMKNEVVSCTGVGAKLLIVTAIATVCYFTEWTIPFIIIMGIAGTIFTLLGISETEIDYVKSSIGYCIVGMLFYFISFYFWYQEGWYTSMTIALWFLSCMSLIYVICFDGSTPMSACVLFILFASASICMWIVYNLSATIFIWGTLLSILVSIIYHAICRKLC